MLNLDVNVTFAKKDAKTLRAEIVESMIDQMAEQIIAGEYPVELVSEALKPIAVQTYPVATRNEKGFAAKVKDAIAQRLEQQVTDAQAQGATVDKPSKDKAQA